MRSMGAPFPLNPVRPGPVQPAGFTLRPVEEPSLLVAPPRRTKLWELAEALHCSIIGTCFSTAELRRVLAKSNLESLGKSEHELHHQGVTLAGKQGLPSKLLHKALDERHRLAIKSFDHARTEDEVRGLWAEARAQGDIPGAYWAALTHPATTARLVREVFGEVHMLSHLVGAANRADIRRLSALEAETAALEDKVERQQQRLHEIITERDTRIAELNALVAAKVTEQVAASPDSDALAGLVADLQRRLDASTRRQALLEERSAQDRAALAMEREKRGAAEARAAALGEELAALEASLAPLSEAPAVPTLDGLAILYVGGQPGLIGHLRAAAERAGARFEHHDGGIDERSGLLPGQVGRADLVLFPVDCISHEAALAVKRLCRQAAKRFLPLRSAGLASFVAALGRVMEPAPVA